MDFWIAELPILHWKTAQEQNTRQFTIEKSDDGINYSAIGTVLAAGNSSIEKMYVYTDNNTGSLSAFYRILETDIDGKKNYSAVNKLVCGNLRDDISVWPSPVEQTLFVRISTNQASAATIRLFNNQGAMVYTGQHALLKGSNQLEITMSRLAAGIYHMDVQSNVGKNRQSLRLVKQ